MLEREWVTVVDPEDIRTHYRFDVSFLTSNWHCIYGQGCPGPEDNPDTACCLHGAYVSEDHEEELVEDGFALLNASTMQYYDEALDGGLWEEDEDGETKTRVVDGACIFSNRSGFAGGTGCALHILSMLRGESHVDRKPIVCWQVPLHREIEDKIADDGEEYEEHTIAAFQRGTWGDGGADFSWWCVDKDNTENDLPEAFGGRVPVFVSMETELRAMVGDAVYDELAAYLQRRAAEPTRVRFLPIVDPSREHDLDREAMTPTPPTGVTF